MGGPGSSGRGNKIVENDDVKLLDSAEPLIVGQQRRRTVLQTGGDLERIGRAQAIGCPKLRRSPSTCAIKLDDHEVRERREQQLVLVCRILATKLKRPNRHFHQRQD